MPARSPTSSTTVGARVLLTDTHLAPEVAAALRQLGRTDLTVVDITDDQAAGAGERLGDRTYEELLAEAPLADWRLPDDEWDALSLNYTSGTSGRPKGVVYHHRGAYLMALGTVAGWGLPHRARYLYTVPLFHCNGWTHAWALTITGGTAFLIRQVNAPAMFDAIAEHGITHMGGAPTVLGMLADAPGGRAPAAARHRARDDRRRAAARRRAGAGRATRLRGAAGVRPDRDHGARRALRVGGGVGRPPRRRAGRPEGPPGRADADHRVGRRGRRRDRRAGAGRRHHDRARS